MNSQRINVSYSGNRTVIAAVVMITLLCVAAFNTENARATIGSHWQVEGLAVPTPTLLPPLQISTFETGGMTLLDKIAGVKVETLCTGGTLEGFLLQASGSVGKEGKVKLTGCLTKLNGAISAACEPKAGGTAKGVINSSKLKGTLVLHEGTWNARLEATTGETLATIEMGAECSIGEKVPVIGKLFLKDSKLGEHLATHLASEGSLTELWVISKTVEHKATADGSAQIELGSEFKGVPWSAYEVGGSPIWQLGIYKAKDSVLSPTLSIGEVESGGLTFLTTFQTENKFALTCKGAAFIGAKLESEGRISSGFKIKFSQCLIKFNEKETPCQPHYAPFEAGILTSSALKGSLGSNSGEGIISIEPQEGGTLLKFEMNEECGAFPPILSLSGKLVLKDSAMRVESTTHLVSGDPLTALSFNEAFFEEKVTFDGSALLQLSGEGIGLPWSGLP
jgi:hypothetical protein